ncbi:MAG TPA: hypothetical protein VGS12_18550 [Caulobacteraceae bacterium]|nr:hypothetical protein [Caulobacteraceae bacterium]
MPGLLTGAARLGTLAAAVVAATVAVAQPAPPPPAAKPAPVASAPREPRRVAAGTMVTVELAEPVGTKTDHRGDHFFLRLAEPVVVDGRTMIAAGAYGAGEVIDAAPGGAFGRPAKLVLAARYIDVDGVRVRLDALRLGGEGRDHATTAVVASAVPYAGVLAILIPGGNVEYPAGTRASARIADDVVLPPDTPPPSPPATPPAPTTPQGKPS